MQEIPLHLSYEIFIFYCMNMCKAAVTFTTVLWIFMDEIQSFQQESMPSGISRGREFSALTNINLPGLKVTFCVRCAPYSILLHLTTDKIHQIGLEKAVYSHTTFTNVLQFIISFAFNLDAMNINTTCLNICIIENMNSRNLWIMLNDL